MKIYSKDGKLTQEQMEQLRSFLGKCKGDYVIEVKKYRKNRSNAQNRTLWDIYRQVSDQTGYEQEEVHAMCGFKFLQDHTKKTPFVKSTASLDTSEFCQYIDKIVRFFTVECGFIIYLPEDYRNES